MALVLITKWRSFSLIRVVLFLLPHILELIILGMAGKGSFRILGLQSGYGKRTLRTNRNPPLLLPFEFLARNETKETSGEGGQRKLSEHIILPKGISSEIARRPA